MSTTYYQIWYLNPKTDNEWHKTVQCPTLEEAKKQMKKWNEQGYNTTYTKETWNK